MKLTSDATHTDLATTPCLISCQKCPHHHHSPLQNAPAINQTSTTPAKKPRSLHNLLLQTLDCILSCLVVAPCVIAYWRGTWELMGVLLFPKNLALSAICSFLIGGLGHIIFTLTQHFFADNLHPDKHRLTFYVLSRCYTFIFGIVCVNMWRGSWVLCDWLTSASSLIIICVVTLVAILFLIATRTVRNLGAAPYSVIMDHKSDYFEVETMFKVGGFHQPGLYVMDTLFSVFVIGSLVVIAWRGLWGIMDLTIYPEDRAKSAMISLIMGYITVLFTFILHPLVRWISKRLSGLMKLLFCDIYYFAEFFGAVNAWRGIWNLLDVYLYPENKIMSYWLTHLIPFLVLAALKCSNSILVRGVYIDAEGPGGKCVDIPISYVKLHFERERNKKNIANQVYSQSKPNLMIKSARGDKEAQSVLIEKPTKPEIKIQSEMDATQLV